MASGCAVVLTDLPVNRELLESSEFLFPVGDYLRAYEVLYSTINNHKNGKDSVEKHIKIAKRFSIEFAADSHVKLYVRCVNAKIPSSL